MAIVKYTKEMVIEALKGHQWGDAAKCAESIDCPLPYFYQLMSRYNLSFKDYIREYAEECASDAIKILEKNMKSEDEKVRQSAALEIIRLAGCNPKEDRQDNSIVVTIINPTKE